MNAPGNHIVVLYQTHLFPSKLSVSPQSKTMNMYFGGSSEYVCLSTELLASTLGPNLQLHVIDIVHFLVGEAYHYFLEAVVL